MQKSGYSMIEVFGVVALVLTLLVVAIPSLRNFQEGGKQGAAVRNASALNSAVQQFDQSGGLLTAQVHVPPGVESISDPSRLPEFAVLNLLRGDERGGQVSAWQEPVFDDTGYRVIWVNPIDSQQAVREGVGGNRHELAENLAASGEGGRFEVINDEGGRLGIVDFRRGDVDADLLVATNVTESPTPTPATSNGAPLASLTVSPASGLVGETFTYIAGGTDPDNDPLSFTFTHPGGTSPTSDSRVFNRAYSSPGTYTVSVRVSDGSLSSQAQATVTVTAAPGSPTVSLAADIAQPYRGQIVTFTATGTDPEGQQLTYRFIQDGAVVQEGPSHTFATSYATLGPKSMAVVAQDPTGLTDGAEVDLDVVNRAPTISLTADRNPVEPRQTVTITVSASDPDGDALTYDWVGGTELQISRSYDTVGVRKFTATVTDPSGAKASTELDVNVRERQVYVLGNYWYPLSLATSAAGIADYSVTLAQHFSGMSSWGGVFNRLQPDAQEANKKYGEMFHRLVVIDSDGALVGVYKTQEFLDLNAGFRANHAGANDRYSSAAVWGLYNTYKDKLAALPDGQTVRVLENAMSSPLLVDLNGDGQPSLLAGYGWQTPRALSPDLTHYRMVDLDGNGPSSWEWVGPDDALLVDLQQLAQSPEKVGFFVFGNHSWGMAWNDGFAALAELDGDKDGVLRGEELNRVGLWRDTNGNAKVEDGEVTQAGMAGITALQARSDADAPEGNYMSKAGAELQNGRTLTVWDWWSAASPVAQLTERGRVSWERGPAEGKWNLLVTSADELFDDGSLEMASTGELIFSQTKDGVWFVRAVATLPNGKAIDTLYLVDQIEGVTTWGMSSGDLAVVNQLFRSNGRLTGMTVLSDGRYASWTVVEQTGDLPPAMPENAQAANN